MKRSILIVLAVQLLQFVQFSLLASPAAGAETQPGIISVNGTGRVQAKPDTALINAGVVTEAKTAAECYDANNIKMNAVYAALKKAGITDENIKTVTLNLSPKINYNRKQEEPERIIGYTLTHIFNIKVKDIKKAGEVIDRVMSAGVNNIHYIQFTIEDNTKLMAQAREAAVKDAKDKAEQLAKGAGVGLDKIQSLTENFARPYPMDNFVMRAASLEKAAAPVQAGELEISDTVSITYTIKQ